MSRTTVKILQTIITLSTIVFCYFLVSGFIAVALGIRLPQPFPTRSPRTVVLSDPLANQTYDKVVEPKEIQKLLDQRPYDQWYTTNIFDCSNMAKETARFLQTEGYHTSIIGDDKNGEVGHAWVFVWTSKNSGWAIETAADTSLAHGSAGEIVGDDWWDVIYVYGQDKNNFVKNWLAGHGYGFYYPPEDRGGLYVLEWNDPSLINR